MKRDFLTITILSYAALISAIAVEDSVQILFFACLCIATTIKYNLLSVESEQDKQPFKK